MKRSAQPFPSGAPDEGGGALDAKKGEFLLEGVGHVLAAVIVPDGEAASDALSERAEAVADPLSDRLEGLEASAAPGGVDADALGGEVVDGDEHRRQALVRPGGGGVGAPHRVRAIRDDRAVVRGAWHPPCPGSAGRRRRGRTPS